MSRCEDVIMSKLRLHGFRLYPTFILDVYKVFWHLDMLFIGVWGHPYSDMPLQVGGEFWGFGGSRPKSWCDVVMSKLRPQQASDWIPHPYCIYNTCIWVYPHAMFVWLGVHFGINGMWLSPELLSL